MSPPGAGSRPASSRDRGAPRGGPAAGVPACDVCGEEEETDDNHLLQCDGCRVYVRARLPHMRWPSSKAACRGSMHRG